MLSSDAGISSMPSSMISNISETEQSNTMISDSSSHQEIIRNNLTEISDRYEIINARNSKMAPSSIVVDPEEFDFSRQIPAVDSLEKVAAECCEKMGAEFHHAAPDVLEMKAEAQNEIIKVIFYSSKC